MTADGWMPLALSRDIAPGTSAGTARDGVEIAVWRDTAGAVHAWEDRCPHRGMKLSFGFVRGDHIACLYHGWQYDAAGQCRYIPAHPMLEVPPSICVRTWAVAEAAGMVWVSLEADPAPPPPDRAATPLRSLYLDRSLADVVDLLAGPTPLGPAARITGCLAQVETAAGSLTLGLHAIGATRCALHITLSGPASPDTLVALTHRTEALRRMAETAEGVR